MRKLLRYIPLLLLVAILGTAVFNELSAQKKPVVESRSVGESTNGSLENGVRLPYKGTNYKYFSFISYYVLNRAYVHSRVYSAVLDGIYRYGFPVSGGSLILWNAASVREAKYLATGHTSADWRRDFMTTPVA